MIMRMINDFQSIGSAIFHRPAGAFVVGGMVDPGFRFATPGAKIQSPVPG